MSEVKDTQEQPKVEIAVENFGPIAEANIDLRPLTVFVGPSNTGKTYFATLIYTMHEVLRGFPRVPLLYGARSFTEIVTDPESSMDINKLEETSRVSEKPKTGDQMLKWSDLPQKMRDDMRSDLKNAKVFSNEFKRCFDLDSDSKLLRLVGIQKNKMTVSLTVSEECQGLWGIKLENSGASITVDEYINDDILIYPNEGETFKSSLLPVGHKESLPYAEHFKLRGNTRKDKKCHYLPASRSGIIQSHRVMASSLMDRATRSDNSELPTLSAVIVDFMKQLPVYEENKEPNKQLSDIADTLESEVLAGKIIAKPLSSGYPEFFYQPQGMTEEMRLSQSSSMVTELTPLVLYLRGLVQQGDTLIIEEPEAHLHPGAQADMAVILARLVRSGVKVIITTHSDWLLEEIGNLILEGLIESKTEESDSWLLPEEVGIWHFQKDVPVTEIPFHSRKGFSPDDYQNVAEGLYNRSVNLQQKYEKQKGESRREST